MIVNLLESPLEEYSVYLKFAVYMIVWFGIIFAFYGINKLVKERNRVGIIALILSIASPGSGFAYSAAYKRAWFTWGLTGISCLLVMINKDVKLYQNIYVAVFLIQAIWASMYANRAGKDLRQKKYKNNRKAIEEAYMKDLMPYINSGHHLAADTNFLMHFQTVLVQLYEKTNVHLFLHPTVFGELEGLKGNKHKEVRVHAQMAFDVLELYQKGDRMQWTRKQKHGQNFTSADQRIITGVLTEIQNGVKLVFASHDKGARILARSLQIPVVDPLEQPSKKIKAKLSS